MYRITEHTDRHGRTWHTVISDSWIDGISYVNREQAEARRFYLATSKPLGAS